MMIDWFEDTRCEICKVVGELEEENVWGNPGTWGTEIL